MNRLQRNKILAVAGGLDLFEIRAPAQLAHETIAETSIRENTGCSLVAIRTDDASQPYRIHSRPYRRTRRSSRSARPTRKIAS